MGDLFANWRCKYEVDNAEQMVSSGVQWKSESESESESELNGSEAQKNHPALIVHVVPCYEVRVVVEY